MNKTKIEINLRKKADYFIQRELFLALLSKPG